MKLGKKRNCLVTFRIVLAAACLFWVVPAAQGAPWDKSKRLERVVKAYDPEKLVSVRGTVTKIYVKHPSESANKNSVGWHMVVQNETDKVDVHLVPLWYMETMEGVVAEGDVVGVSGTWQEAEEKQRKQGITFRLWASSVEKDGAEVLKLRDSNGMPVWSNH